MAIRKYTTLQLNHDAEVLRATASSFSKSGKLSDFQFTPEPGFLYVTTRAISSRVNANHDGWPPEELRQAYMTFVGRPVFVDHNNWDLKKTHGVILDAKLYENKLASGHEDVWVELLIEVDANEETGFPRLAKAIMTGDIDSVSMGADVEYTVCSVCGNQAHDVLQYCAHIPGLKGRLVETIDKLSSKRIKKLCYEDCYGVSFFEISFVFDPADESALISDVMLASASHVSHVRRGRETIAAYSERVGTSMMKVASIQSPDFCTMCGGSDLAISKTGSVCLDCKFEFVADKTIMSLPQEVDTLRDTMDCPQCGAEWNGMVCTSCGFELPPEGLGDPDTDPMGLAMPMGKPEGPAGEEQGGDEEGPPSASAPGSDDEDQDSDDQGSDQKAQPSKSDDSDKKQDKDKKAPPKKTKDKDDDKDKAKSKDDDKSKKEDKSKDKTKDKKTSGKEDYVVSRFDSFSKEATLPQDPPYNQETSPANSVPPYGQAIPGGTPVNGFEDALEPAPAAPAVVQDLDAPDVSGQVGQSMVQVVNQPAGPTNQPPAGSQAGEQLNGGNQGKAASFEVEAGKCKAGCECPDGSCDCGPCSASSKKKKKGSQDESRAEFFRARAAALRERANEFEKKADAVYQTDVRDLDSPPPVELGADATEDITKAISQPEQLLLADTTDVINDGSETGVPSGPNFRDRLPGQVNPFNDASLQGYAPVNPQVTSSQEDDATRLAAKAREDQRFEQRVAAEKTRVLRVANFVDERIEMGLSTQPDKFVDIARFEEMDDATLDGFVQATREFKAKNVKAANQRVRVAASDDRGPIRMPSLGSVSRPVEVEDDPADDYVAFL